MTGAGPVLTQVAILLPFLAVPGIILSRNRPNVREAVSVLVSTALLLTVVALYLAGTPEAGAMITWLEFLPGLSLAFRPEALGSLFALVAGFLWVVTTVYAIGYMRSHRERNQTRFYVFFAVSIGAVMGVAFADNLFTLYVFYEVLTLSTYPLVTHAGTEKARRGGRVYLGLLLGSSIVFFLPALATTLAVAGTLDFTPGGVFGEEVPVPVLSVLLLLFVLGIGKAAIMPVHRWLPAAMVAPTPVSALLHAVAVVKAGVFTLLKVCVYIFGLDTLQALPFTDVLLYLAGFSVLAASLVAMRQDNLKARLAYSTVSQLGYISLGALMATAAGVTGSALHIVMHAFGKITLFFCAGAILVGAHQSEISRMAGLGRRMPVTMGAFLVASLCIIGLPPTGGTWSKWYLLMATVEAAQWPLMALLMLSSLLNIAYLLPIPLRGFFPGPALLRGGEQPDHSDAREAPGPMIAMIVLTSIGCVLLFFIAQPLLDIASMIGEAT